MDLKRKCRGEPWVHAICVFMRQTHLFLVTITPKCVYCIEFGTWIPQQLWAGTWCRSPLLLFTAPKIGENGVCLLCVSHLATSASESEYVGTRNLFLTKMTSGCCSIYKRSDPMYCIDFFIMWAECQSAWKSSHKHVDSTPHRHLESHQWGRKKELWIHSAVLLSPHFLPLICCGKGRSPFSTSPAGEHRREARKRNVKVGGGEVRGGYRFSLMDSKHPEFVIFRLRYRFSLSIREMRSCVTGSGCRFEDGLAAV